MLLRQQTENSLTYVKEVAKDYPEIEMDDWYIDIMTAKLVDEKEELSSKCLFFQISMEIF